MLTFDCYLFIIGGISIYPVFTSFEKSINNSISVQCLYGIMENMLGLITKHLCMNLT